MTNLLFALSVAAIAAAGLWLALRRDLVDIVIGLALVGTAANLFLFGAGRVVEARPPLLAAGETAFAHAVANPLPQALVLTAIVIGFALTCFAVALALRLAGGREVDGDALSAAEPPPARDGEPGGLP
ncbi:multicomponent K+:H+ antiporter subunit C/multicomponent Na+:H+ antiporter subunit C [Crenobacter luteus]|uniref:Cation:proton antiporter n=1 Tax=Crenobacter luteus TaxID=1452487 RepID=A0A161R9L1_9NEIS|nr:NADH-quinone oxidoreductase subunit K [Crenobacter luteus]KZE33538.1 hypothetical protein AVW16_08355 [Crenobacter luteus]TCP13026.1 multicomponent K+:H+ antiporter subunit C/multicomponent Na+:H+ antiporter subunit C [Crenobacter luteus]